MWNWKKSDCTVTELNLFSLSKKVIKSDFGYCDLLEAEEGLEMCFINRRNKIMANDRKHKSDRSKFKVSDF